MAKKIMYLIIHCTATPEGREISKEDIQNWHMSKPPYGNGWSRVGYSDLIQLDGTLVSLTDWNQDDVIDNEEMTWGARGINGISRHVVYSGGLSKDLRKAKDTRTDEQKKSLEAYVRFMILRYPFIKIAGHNQFASKACPSFDVTAWIKSLGIDEKHISQHLVIHPSNSN